jgi:hypothetical protein
LNCSEGKTTIQHRDLDTPFHDKHPDGEVIRSGFIRGGDDVVREYWVPFAEFYGFHRVDKKAKDFPR